MHTVLGSGRCQVCGTLATNVSDLDLSRHVVASAAAEAGADLNVSDVDLSRHVVASAAGEAGADFRGADLLCFRVVHSFKCC